MHEFLIAAVGAIVGSLITWALRAGDRKLAKETLIAQEAAGRAQAKIAELEGARNKADTFTRFRPRIQILGAPGQQSIRLEASEPFDVEEIEYLNGIGARVASEAVHRSGTVIEIPITTRYLTELNNIGPWIDNSHISTEMIFRLNIQQSGHSKQVTHKAQIKQEFQHFGGGMTVVMRVIG